MRHGLPSVIMETKIDKGLNDRIEVSMVAKSSDRLVGEFSEDLLKCGQIWSESCKTGQFEETTEANLTNPLGVLS